MTEKNILLTIQYDGAGFCGWQRQPGKRSAQGEIEGALSLVCGCEVKVNGASRTDAGVHACGQRASFSGVFGIPTERIIYPVNNILNGGKNSIGDIKITAVEEKSKGFHARFDAKGKKYIYRISNGKEADIFKRNYEYHVAKPLDINLMKEAADMIAGTRDFKCFQAAGGEEMKSTVRTVFDIKIEAVPPHHIKMEVKGDSFLYNMVRIMAGTLVEAGLGKTCPGAIPGIIESKDRQNAGHTAPPQGLYLAEVYYSVI